MSRYELDINVSKTRTIGRDGTEDVEWASELRACTVRSVGASHQRDDLDRFFKLALSYAEKDEKDAVLKWAMKRARAFRLNHNNTEFFFDCMIRLSRKSLSTLPILAQSLIESKSIGLHIPMDRVSKFIVDTIRVHSRVGHAFEVSWSLFIAKGLRIPLQREDLSDVFRLESSLCALLCMDLRSRGLIAGGIDESAWLPYGAPDGLRSPLWLLAYEAAFKGWWSDGRRDYVKSDALFGPMYRRGVYFYDQTRNVHRLRRELSIAQTQNIRTRLILNRWVDYL